MGTANIILIITGIIVVLFGIGAFLNPNLTRWINAPGGPKIKSIVAIVVGIIPLVIGYTIEIFG